MPAPMTRPSATRAKRGARHFKMKKAPDNKLLAFINSPIFIWLLSALVLTIGGAYITNHKQCRDDAEKIIERRKHLRQELFSRELDRDRRVANAKTAQEAIAEAMPTMQDKRGSIFADLSNINYSELSGEFLTLTRRIRYTELPDPSIADYRRKSMRENAASFSFNNKERIQEPLDGKKQPPPIDEGSLLKGVQLALRLAFAKQSFEHALDSFAYDFRPDCSVINIAKLTLGYRPPIVFAETSTLYTMADGSAGMLKRDVEVIEQMQKKLDSLNKKQDAIEQDTRP